MKKLILVISCFLMLGNLKAQSGDDITICHTPAPERFALLASNEQFVSSHTKPLKYTHQSEKGKMITFDTPDGKKGNAFFLKAENESPYYLFVIHEWWGLNEQIKREAEKYFGDLSNVNVLALDLYDGKVTDQQQEAAKLMQSVQTERAQNIIKGAFNFAGKDAKIMSVGWCFGGGWSLQTALLAGKQAHAAIVYYGMPEKDVERLKTLQTDVLGIFAGREQWINTQVVEEFAENMKKADKKLEYKIFDAEHAFANPSNPNFDQEAAAEAYKMSIAYLKNRIN